MEYGPIVTEETLIKWKNREIDIDQIEFIENEIEI